MKLIKLRRRIMCDTVRCKNLADFSVDIGLYLGEIHLCKNCLDKLKILLTKRKDANGQEKNQ